MVARAATRSRESWTASSWRNSLETTHFRLLAVPAPERHMLALHVPGGMKRLALWPGRRRQEVRK